MPLLRVILVLLRSRLALIFAFVSKLWLVLTAIRAVRWGVKAAVMAAFVLWLPLPVWLEALPGRIASLPSGMVWLLGLMRFKEGLAIVIGCLVFRFLARTVIESMRD